MNIVYVLVSQKYPQRCYVGLTQDLERRMKEHNNGDSAYTKRYGPWALQVYTTFVDRKRAEQFETYLKSGSGFAFLKRRFL